MQEEQVDQQAEATEEEPTVGAEESSGDSGDSDLAAAVDEQAAQSSGTAAEAEPEVPDDASAKIQRPTTRALRRPYRSPRTP